MATSLLIAVLSGAAPVVGLTAFALYIKADVKAGGRFKGGEFFIEATDKEKSPQVGVPCRAIFGPVKA